MNIHLEFINRSYDKSGWDVILFQRNLATSGEDEYIRIWKRIRQCGFNNRHPFHFPRELAIDCEDCNGNHTQRLPTENGDTFQADTETDGLQLIKSEPVAYSSWEDITIVNNQTLGAISANIYRGDKVLTRKSTIIPKQVSCFRFDLTLYITSYPPSNSNEIEFIHLAKGCQGLNLTRITRADIVMVGAGPGPNSRPLDFRLENVEQW